MQTEALVAAVVVAGNWLWLIPLGRLSVWAPLSEWKPAS